MRPTAISLLIHNFIPSNTHVRLRSIPKNDDISFPLIRKIYLFLIRRCPGIEASDRGLVLVSGDRTVTAQCASASTKAGEVNPICLEMQKNLSFI